MNYFNSNTKFLREKFNLSHAQIATSLGIGRSTWTGYETGLSQPNISGLINIVEFFNISVSDLLEKDLQNVNLNKNEVAEEQAKYVNLNVNPSVNLKGKKGQKQPCQECEEKDRFISVNMQLLEAKSEVIESQKAQIQLLQNQIEQMKYDTQERAQRQPPQQKEAKSA